MTKEQEAQIKLQLLEIQKKKLELQAQMLPLMAKNDYASYVEYTHEGRWRRSNHLLFLCDEVINFVEEDTGHAYDILILQVPPQHGKSMTITETLPSYYFGKHNDGQLILLSYNDDTAERFTRRNKEKIRTFGKTLFDIEISQTIDRATEFELSNNVGRMVSSGIKGSVTSNPAKLIIIDDPIKNRAEADSETYRAGLWEEWQNTIKTRLAAGAKIIVIMTRWHEDDLAGRIIKNEKHVKVINLKCEDEGDDPEGFERVGKALFPEIGKGDAWLEDFKGGYQTSEGTRAWLALYQGSPSSVEGNLIKRSWWKYYEELPKRFDEVIQSWDCTFKGESSTKNKKRVDFVVGQVWGRSGANKFLLDQVRAQMDMPATLAAVTKMTQKWPQARAKLIEGKANGSAVIQMLHKKIPGLIEIEPEGGKVARVSAVSPDIEAGNVWLPKFAGFTNDLVEECSSFPNGAHDDQVDAMSQALNRLIGKTYSTEETEDYEPEYAVAFGRTGY
jgi:predicted phage terminase large subunit-like protein